MVRTFRASARNMWLAGLAGAMLAACGGRMAIAGAWRIGAVDAELHVADFRAVRVHHDGQWREVCTGG